MIKECPRCGSDTNYKHMHNRWHVLTCNGCNAAITGLTEEEVIKKWNSRSDGECPHCGEGGKVIKMCYSGIEAVASYAVKCSGCGCSVADSTEAQVWNKWGAKHG